MLSIARAERAGGRGKGFVSWADGRRLSRLTLRCSGPRLAGSNIKTIPGRCGGALPYYAQGVALNRCTPMADSFDLRYRHAAPVQPPLI